MQLPNPELQLANDYVQHTGCNIFLTGKAGTGKTTFLHTLQGTISKRMIVTAPTGVAAINAGGVTLHSFFQLPFGPFVPGSEAHDHRQRKFSREKRNIIKSLDLLVIDEISMVRADLLDGVDAVLRRYRQSDLPFGGVQLLMIGDLHQLPPVVKEDEWNLLRPYYDSVYFFSSQALGRTELVPIELQHNYRQSDQVFIELLNRVRDNRLDPATLGELNQRCVKEFDPAAFEDHIILCTHNQAAVAINETRLKDLQGKIHRFEAEIEGDFPSYSYPTVSGLELKKNARVMFMRNDPSPEKQYFNGKIGRITRIANSRIYVRCPGEAGEIEVEPATWENITYGIDPETREIVANRLGTFIQYPLKLAWAITIHKSQGLTFERVVIDAGAAFAPGQIYVALSRCKTLEGVVLSSPISTRTLRTEGAVLDFDAKARLHRPSPEKLEAAKVAFQEKMLLECFDFQRFRFLLNRFVQLLFDNLRSIQMTGVDDLRPAQKTAVDEVAAVGENFQRQLTGLLANRDRAATDAAVRERTTKASVYFQEKLAATADLFFKKLRVETDNKELRQKVEEARDRLRLETAVKLAASKSCREGFALQPYLKAIAAAAIDDQPAKAAKSRGPEYTAAEVGHPELFRELKDWRERKAAAAGVEHYRILHQRVLIQIAMTLPDSPEGLMEIKGIGRRTAEKYGPELVALVAAYRRKNSQP